MDLERETFYKNCFENLKSELDFDYCAVFFKNGNRYNKGFESSSSGEIQESLFTLKIPILVQNGSVGYFLLKRANGFSKSERAKVARLSGIYSDKIKEFELSGIFKNQLSILQDAILKKEFAAKKLEEENEKLVEADKIRAEFLANVSHELRTPLNSIIGFSTALKDEMLGEMNEGQKDYANKILSSAIHLAGLINDILDMTKIEFGSIKVNMRPVLANEIIKEVLNTIEPIALEKNIKIKTDFGFSGEIPLDEQKFRQIIYNLAGNAIKFSYPNSKIIISTGEKCGKVFIKVRDFGIGIEKSEQKRIFEKFVQLDNVFTKKYSSTGLGLTITKELVKLQNGKIGLKSAPDKGSEFVVEFFK